jgi:hypothetical protein
VARPENLGERYIEITIGRDGAPVVEAHGFTDGTCRKATERVRSALGGKVLDDKLKDGVVLSQDQEQAKN